METVLNFKTVEKGGKVIIPAICAKELAICECLSKMTSEDVPFSATGGGKMNHVQLDLRVVGNHQFLFCGYGTPSWQGAEIISAYPINAKLKTIYAGTVEDYPVRQVVVE